MNTLRQFHFEQNPKWETFFTRGVLAKKDVIFCVSWIAPSCLMQCPLNSWWLSAKKQMEETIAEERQSCHISYFYVVFFLARKMFKKSFLWLENFHHFSWVLFKLQWILWMSLMIIRNKEKFYGKEAGRKKPAAVAGTLWF